MTWKSIEPSKDVSFRRCVPRFVKDEDVITSPRNGCITFFFIFFHLAHLFIFSLYRQSDGMQSDGMQSNGMQSNGKVRN